MKHFLILSLGLLLATACKPKKEDAPKQNNSNQAVTVDVIIATEQTVSSAVQANGTVVAYEYVELHPEVSGRLTYLNVPEGTRIQQGTLVARVNDADLQAQLNKTKVLLEMAVKTEDRLRKLLAISGVNQGEYDLAQNAVNSYKADMAYTQSLIEKTIIKAPFSGVIGLRQVSPGAYVTAATIIATIQQVEKIKIDFTLPEEYGKMIHKGDSVDVQIDATNKTIKKATVLAIEPQVNQATRNLKIRAILEDNNVNPGAYVKVFLSASREQKTILIPSNAIIPDDKNKQVVLVKDGKASFVNIETGNRQASTVEVLKGLTPGDSVVVTGLLFARPQSTLKVKNVKQLEQLVN